jgi:hypothetical protein
MDADGVEAMNIPGSTCRGENRVRIKTYAGLRWLGLVAPLACLAACGLNVQQPDLFLLTRTGAGSTLTELVNTGGTVRCDGGKTKQVPDKLLLEARTLTGALNRDARHHLDLPSRPGSVYRYRVKVQDGTIAFPDTAARDHPELARLELLALGIASGPCRGS